MKYNKLIILLYISLCFYSIESKNLIEDGPLKIIALTTKEVASDGGSIYTLEHHNLNCGIGVLTQFNLKKLGPYKCQFEYKCVQPSACNKNCENFLKKQDGKKCKSESTKPESVEKNDKKSVMSLKSHKIDCGKGRLLTQIAAKSRKNLNKLYYNYTCCQMKVGACKVETLAWKSYAQDMSINIMDGYKVGNQAPLSNGIQTIKLEVDAKKKSFRYEITTCIIIG